jgi:hypothetical protein
MQKALLIDPAAALDDLAVHDRDLPGGPAKAVQADICPEPRRRTKRHLCHAH